MRKSKIAGEAVIRRLTKEERRAQLLETARLIVREEGADRLTLGRLAERAGVSKPVAYDHFATRTDLLVELYRELDLIQINDFRDAMATNTRCLDETVDALATAYIQCAANMDGEVQKIGAALAGSEAKPAALQELLDHCVQMFVDVLKPHSPILLDELQRRCVGLVGAGEAFAAALVREQCSETDAVAAFVALIHGALQHPGT